MKAEQILKDALLKASKNLNTPVSMDAGIRDRLDYICRVISNRAGIRLLLACLLAKVEHPHLDPRKPYTEIGTNDSFSGRTYDERYLGPFINENQLPCNQTTAFLTPALRNINRPLTTDIELVGRPREVYVLTLQLLDDVYKGDVAAFDLLIDAIRLLILVRNEKKERMETLLAELRRGKGALPLSSEAIVNLIEQHLACKNTSRLPVLIVAAAYQAASSLIGEYIYPLNSHNAADLQTGAIGDVEVSLKGDNNVVTAYEMKMKRVTLDDINVALQKIIKTNPKIHN